MNLRSENDVRGPCSFFVLCISAIMTVSALFAPGAIAAGIGQIRAGTIEVRSHAAATDKGIATYGFNLTDMAIDESLKLNLVFKFDRGNEKVRVYEIDRAEVDFNHRISGKTGVEAEAGMMKVVVPEEGRLKKGLSRSECDLALYIDLKEQTYRISGKVSVSGIPFSSRGRLTSKVAGAPTQTEDLSDQWTEDREEEIEIEGELDPQHKDILQGEKSQTEAAGEFGDWISSFWKGLFGGDFSGSISWDVRVPMLVIEKDGKDITYDSRKDNVQEEIAGKAVRLMGRVKPSHLKASDHEWTFPEAKCVKDYRAGDSRGEKVELEEADKKKEEVEFHWYDEGDRLKLVCGAKVEGEKLSAETLFNVKKPGIKMKAEIPGGEFAMASVTYKEGNDEKTGDELIYDASPGIYSIKFTHDPLPAQFPGETQFVQLVRTVGRAEKHKEALTPCMETEQRGLDASYPYSPGPEATDAPGVPVSYLDLNVSVKHRFQMHLMFKPEGEGSIFVPLRVINWEWTGLARREAIGDAFSVAGSKISKDPSDRKAEDYPEWDMNVHGELEWDACR